MALSGWVVDGDGKLQVKQRLLLRQASESE
jgi:hypothetical protein